MTPTPDQIRSQLERILASSGFAGSDRAKRFLRYVVERTLNGEGDQLKEYVIGREVFDRGEDYDPRVDSIVRVEAGRLRSKVEEYYAGPGRTDPVIVQLRRGGYAPAFEARTEIQPEPVASASASSPFSRWRIAIGLVAAALVVIAAIAWGVGNAYVGRPELGGGEQPPKEAIAVLPFASYSTDEATQLLAARVTDDVTGELARLGTLSVVSHTTARQYAGARGPLREVAKALNTQIVLEGNVRDEAGHVTISVRLVDATTDRKFWVDTFNGSALEIPEIERRIATSVAAAVLQRKR